MKFAILLVLLTLAKAVNGQKTPTIENKLKEFDTYVEQSRKEWSVPGLSIVVIKDNKVIFEKGYGVTELGKEHSVGIHTQFSIGSTTKAMTATCLGMLVDEGKVNWNDPVINYLPEFRLKDSYATREMRIRDLFTHNSGVGNADFLWGNMKISSDDIVKKLASIDPKYGFRGGFIYQNIFYLVAGKVIERISGKPWEEFIKEKIFKPLGMAHTVPFLKNTDGKDQSMPHFLIDGKITVIESMSADAVGPAGSVWSCIDDMGRWATCMLDSSKFNGIRLLSAKTWSELFKPQVIVPSSEFYPTIQILKPNWITYGLGWFQHDYKGKKINYHTGSLPGEIAMHAQLPSEKLAVYIFGNYDHAEVRHSLVYKTFDHFSLGGDTNWSTEFLKLYDKIKGQQTKIINEQFTQRVIGTKSTFSLTDYVGQYENDIHGKIEISLQGQDLHLDLNKVIQAKLSHWHFETFSAAYEKKWFGKNFVTFSINESGAISALEMDGIKFNRR